MNGVASAPCEIEVRQMQWRILFVPKIPKLKRNTQMIMQKKFHKGALDTNLLEAVLQFFVRSQQSTVWRRQMDTLAMTLIQTVYNIRLKGQK